jgi:hypothetical protein
MVAASPLAFRPVNDVAEALAARKQRQAFYTPLALVQKLVEWSHVLPSMRVLEPSAGDGRIVHELQQAGVNEVDACEIDDAMRERIATMGANVVGSDFLTYKPGPVYDVITMNPPFTKGQIERHLEHAWSLLAPHGRCLSIGPMSLPDKLHDCRLNLPGCTDCTYSRLGREWFTEYGTNIEVCVVELIKDGPRGAPRHHGFLNHATWNAALTITSDGDLYRAHRGKLFTTFATRDLYARHIGQVGCSTYGVDWEEVAEDVRRQWQFGR